MAKKTFRGNLLDYVLSLLGRYLDLTWREGWIRFDSNDVMEGWPDELRSLFQERSRSMMPEPGELETAVSGWQGLSYTQFWKNIVAMAKKGDELAIRWKNLVDRLNLSQEEISLLAIMCAVEFDWPLLRALRFAMAEQTPGRPKWGFMVRFIAGNPLEDGDLSRLHPKRSRLFKDKIIRLDDLNSEPLSVRSLSLFMPVASYLMGYETDEEDAFESAMDSDNLDDEVKSQMIRASQSKSPVRASIEGAVGSGKIFASRALARQLGCSGIWIVDILSTPSFEEALERIADARAQAAVYNAILVIPEVSGWISRWGDSTREIIKSIESSSQPVAWLITGDVPTTLHIETDAHIRIAMPNRAQREVIWRKLLGADFDQNWISQLSGQFLLTRGQIETAVRTASSHPSDTQEQTYNQMAEAARILSKEGLGSLATPEPARVSFDQLIVSEECRTALEDLLMYARHRKELAKNWGFDRAMPYGLGLAALFSGPPGTGKTFGAQIIATELQLELYRVDLSQLVSKYIGETEKHLAELFNVAENGEVLLLFDEADAVFGKRTEVKNSVDRYANLEVNYLLQRLERFTGVSILTSNFDSAIDEAFMRRIRFKVPFEMPEAESRLVLWNKFLRPAIPRSDDVDLEMLANTYELSGGHIKEAVLRAASIAYGSEEQVVTQDLLIRSAELEYKKLGKLAPQLSDYEAERYL